MIGLYGGTFDPIHYGHLRTALDVLQLLHLEHIKFIPCAYPAHREKPVASAVMRLQMLRLAISKQANFIVDRRELDRQKPSYMIDTLKLIRAEVGQQALLLIIGADTFKYLSSWHQWQKIFDYAHILVMSRPGSIVQIEAEQEFLHAKLTKHLPDLSISSGGYLYFQEVTRLDISATRIRKIFATGAKAQFLLPDQVIDFINSRHLYEDNSKIKNKP